MAKAKGKRKKAKRPVNQKPEELAEELGREQNAEITAFANAASSKPNSLLKIASNQAPRARRRANTPKPDLSHIEAPGTPNLSSGSPHTHWFSSSDPEPSTEELEDMETRARAKYNYFKYRIMTMALPVMAVGAALGIVFGFDHAMEIIRIFIESFTNKTLKLPR